jgi:hypothetical protein
MPQDEEAHEQSRLLGSRVTELSGRRSSHRAEDASSIISSHLSKEELALGGTAIGERLPYNDYTTIDWLHDLVSSLYNNNNTKTHYPNRSRTPTGSAIFTPKKASEIELGQHGTLVKDGSRQQ